MATQLSTGFVKGAGVPESATAFAAVNGTKVSAAASPQAIKAAVTGKRHWITRAIFTNITTGEEANLSIADGSTKKCTYTLNGELSAAVTFDPPIEISSGAAINAYCEVDSGDSYISIQGYVEA